MVPSDKENDLRLSIIQGVILFNILFISKIYTKIVINDVLYRHMKRRNLLTIINRHLLSLMSYCFRN